MSYERLPPKPEGGAEIEVWQVRKDDGPNWRFAVITDNTRFEYAGVPNKCYTRHQAICRARIRAKWVDSGEYQKHYRPFIKPV